MNLMIYALTAVIVLLGFPIGIFLKKVTGKEVKQAKKYFILLKNLLVSAVITVFLFAIYSNFVFLLLSFIILFIVSSSYSKMKYDYVTYLLFLAILFFAQNYIRIFYICSVLMFFYGFVRGSLSEKKSFGKIKFF